jgi:hypothetical protein
MSERADRLTTALLDLVDPEIAEVAPHEELAALAGAFVAGYGYGAEVAIEMALDASTDGPAAAETLESGLLRSWLGFQAQVMAVAKAGDDAGP